MPALISRRLITSGLTILICTVLVFAFRYLLPGGPVEAEIFSSGQAVTHAEVIAMDRQYGLDRPIFVQYADWIIGLAHGSFGSSFGNDVSVGTLLGERAGPSIEIIVGALLLALLLGCTLGAWSAIRRDRVTGRAILAATGLGISIPDFWLATILASVVGLTWRLLPAIGFVPISAGIGANLRSVALPILSLGLIAGALLARHTFSSMSHALNSPFVRTAWAMGLPPRIVYLRCALPNAVSPVIILLPLIFTSLIGGTVLVENVFDIPGLGSEIVTAVSQQNYPVIQALVLLTSVVVAVLNLLSDLTQALIDPRVRRR